MKFFVPDWDDRVDPGYHFLTDRFSRDRDPYRDDVYAHELLSPAPYDGVLVSRSAIGESGPKREQVNSVGMRAYLRLPDALELLGDCGAFGYVRDRDPPYETGELIEYYDRMGFDYGVSVDHLIVPEFEDQRAYRYDLTLRNTKEFLTAYRSRGRRFVPIGAVQGWDMDSYIEATKAVVGMGYNYIAIGGLVRSSTRQLRELVGSIMALVPDGVRVHIFGVARSTLLPMFLETGVASVDSAAPLRQAWLSAHDNYYTMDRTYAAIRIPVAIQERPKRQTLVGRSESTLADLVEAERAALEAVRAYAASERRLRPTLDALMTYDDLLASRQDGQSSGRRRALYHETLRDQPWKRCRCDVCKELGVEVIIFRGNNRNRRRGFHNLWVLKQRMCAMLSDAQVRV